QSPFRIYSTSLGKEVSLEEVVRTGDGYNAIFFGEEHDDPTAHLLEDTLVQLMYAAWPGKFAVGMEMFERDVQNVMDEYLLGFIKEKHFTEDARPWSNYEDYRPVVEFARENGIHVICSNAARRYTNLAVRKGKDELLKLPEDSKLNVAPLPYDTARGPYYNKLMMVMTHGTTNPADTSQPIMSAPPGIVNGQSLWDATMAWSMAEYLRKHKGHKVLHMNGRFHSDEHYGIVIQLKKYFRKSKVMVISCYPADDFAQPDWNQHKANGDFVILTDPSFRLEEEED
ncbi:MAG: ChaN family lipoprotein, partial [Flavobacteriales bacterium]|nr:ChaN family lipoprotein [Flavobacteriales bacterium]